jgi:hypothetical protein
LGGALARALRPSVGGALARAGARALAALAGRSLRRPPVR